MVAGHGEERTANMPYMAVTLEVSKLSGWLNADARCRESNGCGARCCGREAGGRRANAVHAACRGGLDCGLRAGHGEERTANMEYMFVTLEVSKLSDWLNADARCRESKKGHAMQGVVYGSGAAGGGRPRRHAACRRGRGC